MTPATKRLLTQLVLPFAIGALVALVIPARWNRYFQLVVVAFCIGSLIRLAWLRRRIRQLGQEMQQLAQDIETAERR